jgi:hypothetical protein
MTVDVREKGCEADYARLTESLQGCIICSSVFIQAYIDVRGADGYIS